MAITPVMIQNPMTPLVILEHFARNYPDATPFWSMEGKDYTVMFIDPQTALRHIILYDKHGTILRSENELDTSSCPEIIKDYYTTNYPNQTFDIWLYEDITGNRKYYLKHRSREIWFDKDGNFQFKKRVFL
jgi:hypothetical protein